MENIKKISIGAFALAGGLIGGTLSVIGKTANIKIIDEIGESIFDGALLTGAIVGDIASGAAELASGAIQGVPEQWSEGLDDLKSGGGRIVNNITTNVGVIVDNSGEIIEGLKEKDNQKVAHGTKTLAKMAAIGAVTVGAIKLVDSEKKEEAATASPDRKVSPDKHSN